MKALTPNNDDLLRAASWLEDQADEADAVADAFTGDRVSTAEATQTRQTATWLRHQVVPSGASSISVTFRDEYHSDSAGPGSYASVLLAELKGAIEYGDLSASTPVNITIETTTAGGNTATLLDREWTDTGVNYGPNPVISLHHHLEPEDEEDLLRKLLIVWTNRSEASRRLAGSLLAELDSRAGNHDEAASSGPE